MTVCLTGDVHDVALDTRDQEYLSGTELDAAVEYAEIAASYDVPVTLFVTGRAATERPERVRELAAERSVEVGGHNYYAFDTLVHAAWRGIEKVTGGRIGSWNGPKPFQSWEIAKTIDALETHGARIRSWRDHAYRHDEHTAGLLAAHGITHFSDVVGPHERVRKRDGTISVPVNTPPDHEHMYHAFRTPEYVANSDFEGPFGAASYDPDGWLDWLLEHLTAHSQSNRPATVLAHPACMRLADDFDAFERLCDHIAAEHEPVLLSEIGVST